MGCENCDNWVHIKCCGVTPVQYAAYQRGENLALWECPRCNPPVSTADVSSSDSDSFDLSSHSEPTPPRTHKTHDGRTKTTDRIIVSVINLRSVRSRGKAAALKAHISDTNADIIIANESEITPEIVDSDFLPSNYTAIRDDKCPTKHGVFVAFRNSLIVTQVEIVNRTCEFVLARLQVLGNPDLYIGSFYRHTNSDPNSLHSLIENVTHLTRGAKFPNLIIAGDFNLPDVNWDEQTVNMSPQYGNGVN